MGVHEGQRTLPGDGRVKRKFMFSLLSLSLFLLVLSHFLPLFLSGCLRRREEVQSGRDEEVCLDG